MPTTLAPGDRLPNGATVVAIRNDVVLALRPGHVYDPYVTWSIGPDGGTYSGHYHNHLDEAVADFADRAGVRA